jgi:PAS domain S-box-containing protein
MTLSGTERPQLSLVQLASLIDLFPVPAWAHCQGRIVCANAPASDLLGAGSPARLVGKSVLDIAPESDRERIDAVVRINSTTGNPLAGRQETLRRFDGGLVEVELSAKSVDCDGRHTRVVMAVDQTERNRAQRTTAKMVALLESTDLAIVGVTMDGTVEAWNRGAERIFGYSSQEAIGRPFSILNPGEKSHEMAEALEQIAAGQSVPATDADRRRKDGTLVSVLWGMAPIRNSKGEITGAVATLRDVAERKQAERELRASEERLKLAQVAAGVGTWGLRFSDGVLECSEEYYRLFGLSSPPPNHATFDWVLERVHADDRDGVLERLSQARREGVYDSEFRIVWPDGSIRWIAGRAQIFADAWGQPERMLGASIDITGRKQSEQALRESEERYRALSELIPQLVWTADEFGRANTFNRRWHDYTSLDHTSSEGFGWLMVVHPDDQRRTAEAWIRSIQTGETYSIEHRLRRGSDGMYRWHLAMALPAIDFAGKARRWYGTCTDVHDQRLSAEVLRRNNEDLKQFAYAASHDLQEPLRMVMSYTQLLSRRYPAALDENAQRFVGFVVEGASRMEQLLSGLREYWQASEHGAPALIDVDLNQVLERVLLNLRAQMQEQSGVVTADKLPIVRAEFTPLVQLLQNLISNALKYRHSEREPRVHVTAQNLVTAWMISVVDNGVGIEPQYRDQVFKIFKRLHGRHIPGTGIGLALCQRIAERYGGALLLESTPDEGSIFSFTIPT